VPHVIRTTPFHDRLAALNETGLFQHWSAHLVSSMFQLDDKAEYFAVRNSAGLIDTSPLYTYRISGPDAERLLAGTLARDVRTCVDGQAQYTVWCDDDGYVIEDGVVFRHAHDDYWLTAAEPNLTWFEQHAVGLDVVLTDISASLGALAVQGPRSAAILAALAPEVPALRPFRHIQAEIGGRPVVISRTGYTGDLGYEVWVEAEHAEAVFDAIWAEGRKHLLTPVGQQAFLSLRIEAGLLMVGQDFVSSRYAFTDSDRLSPLELGLGWMMRDLATTERAFIGRAALRREVESGSSRWAQVGIEVDWREWDALHRERGLIPPKDHTPTPWEMMLFGAERELLGHTTSFLYSPVLQRHIGMARVRPDVATVGTPLRLEITVDHRTETVGAQVVRTPFFNPPRKTA